MFHYFSVSKHTKRQASMAQFYQTLTINKHVNTSALVWGQQCLTFVH